MKRILILGLFAIGIAITGGAYYVSAKEKPDVVYLVDIDQDYQSYDVSRGTSIGVVEFVASYQAGTAFFGDGSPVHNDALLPVGFYLDRVTVQNDPYLKRSQKWIRDRNLRISGLQHTFDTNKSFKTQFLS